MQPTNPDTWKPKANHLLVAVPSRFEYKHTPGVKRLVLPSGSDDWQALGEQLKAGIDVQIETDEQPIPVCQGQVLAVCDHLTDDMHLCAGPFTRQVPELRTVIENGKSKLGRDGNPILVPTGRSIDQPIPRTAADITQRVEVGDTIHFDHYALHDGSEVNPGVYLIGYVDVIAKFENQRHYEGRVQCWQEHSEFLTSLGIAQPGNKPSMIFPIGGYVLLTRVWADDVEEAEVDGRTRKVRKGALGLIDVVDVPPLAGEGIVARHSSPLRNVPQVVQVGDRVVVDQRHARVETIGGVEYLAVRQDFVTAVREQIDDDVAISTLNPNIWYKRTDAQKFELGMRAATRTRLFPHFIPTHHPAYNA